MMLWERLLERYCWSFCSALKKWSVCLNCSDVSQFVPDVCAFCKGKCLSRGEVIRRQFENI